MRFNLNLKPREVESYLREQVLKAFGDAVENNTKITSGHGFYSVDVQHNGEAYSMGHFRKSEVPRVVKALRYLAGK